MLALKEFVNFLTHNKTNLALTYAELLVNRAVEYEIFPSESRLTSARKLLNAVIEAFEVETADPLCQLFDQSLAESQQRWGRDAMPPDPWAEIECLGQTLSPVVTNLIAGKFLWQILAAARSTIRQAGDDAVAKNGVTQRAVYLSSLPSPDENYDDIVRQLRESEERFRALSEATLEMAVIVQDGLIVDVNTQATSMFNMDRMEAIGKSVLEFVAEDSVERVKEAMISQDGKPYETRFRKADGTFFYGEIAGKSIVYKGQPVRVATIRDITERKQFEETLAKRAHELELVAKVSEQAATTRNLTQMLQDVCDLTKDRFNLYHAHIYLLNQAGDTLELVAGAGKAGQQMIAQGWRIPFDREDSLVAQAARTRRGVIINDVRQTPNFLPNPLLPETRSEMAIPMITGEKVVGVLDVQSDQIGRFTDEDVWIETILANQIAAALENARLLEQAQQYALRTEAQAQHERLLREITDRVRGAADIDTIMRTTVREVGRALGREVFVSIGNQRQANDTPPSQPPLSIGQNGHHQNHKPVRPTEEK